MPLPGSFSNVAVNKQDDVSIVTGTDAGTTTNVGDHAAHHNLLGNAVNGLEDISASWTNNRIFNVESPEFGAIADEFYNDGVATAADATFTSATANFTGADVGRHIMILRSGISSAQDHHTTILSVTNSTTVELAANCGRNQNPAKFYLTRHGADAAASTATNDAAIAAAITAAYDARGGVVLFPGVGYLMSGLTLKRRVVVKGATPAVRGTLLHLAPGSNRPIIMNDQTRLNSADNCGVENLWLDGNRWNQTDFTTTLASAYTAGQTTLSLTAAPPQESGSLLIGTNRLLYSAVTGTGPYTLSSVSGGAEGSTDANASNGATVTLHRCHGIYFQPVPHVSMSEGVGEGAELFDPNHFIRRIFISAVKGDGVHLQGLSDTVIERVSAYYCAHFGFRPSFDTKLIGCTSGHSGRAGYYVRNTQTSMSSCFSYYCGNETAAEGWGFLFDGPKTLETGGKSAVACHAQDCKAEGLHVRNAQRVLFTGILDSNGVGGTAGQYAAAKLDGATNGIFDLECVERMQDGTNAKQQHALYLASTDLQCQQNSIRLSHAGTQGVGVGRAIKAGSDIVGMNDITINGAKFSPWKAPVRAASTANVAPTNPDTTLTAEATAGTQTLLLTSAAGFRIGDRILMTPATLAEEATITNLVTTTATLAAPTTNTHVNGATIRNVSALLAGGASLVVDGVTTANFNRILLKNQTVPWQNGLYNVTGVGTSVVLLRAQDGDQDFHFNQGLTVSVPEGTTQADTLWQMTSNYPIVFGNTDLVFASIAPRVKFTPADVADATSAGLTTLTALDFAVAANTAYAFQYYIPFISTATTTGISLAMSAPASPTTFSYQAQIPFAADGAAGTWLGSGTANDDIITSTGVISTSLVYLARVDCVLRNGANAGTVSIKFAPETNNSVTVRAGAVGTMNQAV